MHKYRLVTFDTKVPMDDAEVIATFPDFDGALSYARNWMKPSDTIDILEMADIIDIINANGYLYCWLEVAA